MQCEKRWSAPWWRISSPSPSWRTSPWDSRGSSGTQEALQVLKRLFRYSRGSSGTQEALQVLKRLFRYSRGSSGTVLVNQTEQIKNFSALCYLLGVTSKISETLYLEFRQKCSVSYNEIFIVDVSYITCLVFVEQNIFVLFLSLVMGLYLAAVMQICPGSKPIRRFQIWINNSDLVTTIALYKKCKKV